MKQKVSDKNCLDEPADSGEQFQHAPDSDNLLKCRRIHIRVNPTNFKIKKKKNSYKSYTVINFLPTMSTEWNNIRITCTAKMNSTITLSLT